MKFTSSRRFLYVAVLLLISLASIYLILYNREKKVYKISPKKLQPSHLEIAKKCYFHNGRNTNATGKSVTFFEDLLTSRQPDYDRNIFFVESECSHSGIVDMKPRHACSIETAAKANPSRDIYMIYLSPVGLPLLEQDWSSTVKTLLSYPNIHFRTVQLKQLCSNTPMEQWIKTDALFHSIARYEHASDIVRLILLYKFGGTYLDLDYMMLRSVDAIPRNWVAFQKNDTMANAAFDFRHNGIGHIFTNEALREIAVNYNPNDWGRNGPDLMLRVLRPLCGTDNITSHLKPEACRGIHVYSWKRFYPLWAAESRKFFQPDDTEAVLDGIEEIVGFHWWNSGTKDMSFVMRDGDAYDLIAAKHCPNIHEQHETF